MQAQINKLTAQTEYYRKPANPKSYADILTSMIGTLIGAGLALAGVYWSAKRQEALEEKKRNEARRDETTKELKQATSELLKVLASQVKSIMWLTWIGKNDTAYMKDSDISEYNIDMKALFRDSMAAQAYLISINPEQFVSMEDLIKTVSNIDHRMSLKIRQFMIANSKEEHFEAAQSIGLFYEEVANFYKEMPDNFGRVLPKTSWQTFLK